MRIPATAMTGHLMWTRSGTIWATWRLQGLARGFGNSETNQISRNVHRTLFQSIHGEYLLLGLTADLDPVVIVNQMLDGVDVTENPGWAEEALLTLDHLAERPLGKREFWISVPLRAGSWKNRILTWLRSLESSVRESLSLPKRPPSAAEITAAMQAAGKIEEVLPAQLAPRRATVAEQVWIAAHSQTRGLGVDEAAPLPSGKTLGGISERYRMQDGARFTSPSVFPEPVVDEGGQTDPDAGRLARFNPLSRRFLKVINTRLETVSYQVMMALSGSPKGGWDAAFDWVGRLDELGVAADWAFRISTIKARDAKNRNSRAEANLADQMDQQDGTAAITGSGGELDEVAQTLADYHKALGSSEKEVEVQTSLLVAVGADTPDEARDRAAFIAKDFRSMDFIFDTPLGAQEALWWGMQPGVPTERAVREFTEITTGSDFATLLPLTSSDLGDDKGILLAENITSGTARPVMLDLWGQITGDVSGSIGAAGELGAGKSVFIKVILGSCFDRGARFVATDRTPSKEYSVFAKSLDPNQTAIADLTEPEWSLDPLRVFGPRIGAGQMLTLCSALLGVPARSPEGVMLAELLAPERAEATGLTSAAKLLEQLRALSRDEPTAKNLAGLMGLYSHTEYGAVLFNEDLPPLDLTKRAIVFLTHGVALPDKEEIDNPVLFAELGMDKLFGRAMYALLMRMTREICFSNPNELAVAAFDEVAHINDSPQGQAELTWFLRDGRKHGAPGILGGHSADDFGNEVTRALIKNRVLMRVSDDDLAMKNLEWFHKGFGSDPELVRMVTEDLSPLGPGGNVPLDRRGEALFRDARGRMGKIRTTISLRPDRRKATLTTPVAAGAQQEIAS